MLGLKKFKVVINFLKDKKKILKFKKFIYNDFFSRLGWSCDHPSINMEPPLSATPKGSIGHMTQHQYFYRNHKSIAPPFFIDVIVFQIYGTLAHDDCPLSSNLDTDWFFVQAKDPIPNLLFNYKKLYQSTNCNSKIHCLFIKN